MNDERTVRLGGKNGVEILKLNAAPVSHDTELTRGNCHSYGIIYHPKSRGDLISHVIGQERFKPHLSETSARFYFNGKIIRAACHENHLTKLSVVPINSRGDKYGDAVETYTMVRKSSREQLETDDPGFEFVPDSELAEKTK